MNKKGQGISINVVIVAAIALLVLVVLSVIFMGRLNIFNKDTSSCEVAGSDTYKCFDEKTVCGTAGSSDGQNAVEYPTPFTSRTCPTTHPVCCMKGPQ